MRPEYRWVKDKHGRLVSGIAVYQQRAVLLGSGVRHIYIYIYSDLTSGFFFNQSKERKGTQIHTCILHVSLHEPLKVKVARLVPLSLHHQVDVLVQHYVQQVERPWNDRPHSTHRQHWEFLKGNLDNLP